MKKINSCDFLNYIYKATNILIIRLESFNNIYFTKEKEEYLSVIKECKILLKKCDGVKDKISLIDKISNKIIRKNNNVIINKNEKIIDGLYKKRNAYSDNDKNVIMLYNKLIKIIKRNNILLKKANKYL